MRAGRPNDLYATIFTSIQEPYWSAGLRLHWYRIDLYVPGALFYFC